MSQVTVVKCKFCGGISDEQFLFCSKCGNDKFWMTNQQMSHGTSPINDNGGKV
jgi:hypothetical protein